MHATAVRRSEQEAWPRVQGGGAPRAHSWRPGLGAKSGQRREVQLTYFHGGSDPILIASNSARPKHPHWYYNLKAHPECELGDEKFLATEVTDPDEHARLYGLAEQYYAGWSDYRQKADPIGRQIPVFRLTPR